MTDLLHVYLETGQKRTVAGAVDWPGWCRIAKDEASALQALVDYGPRYALVLNPAGIHFQAPADGSVFAVAERLAGNATTDFGVPGLIPQADHAAVSPAEQERLQALLLACWQALERAVQGAAGKTLRKGPRGGGRETEAIMQHVIGAERAYLDRLGWKRNSENEPGQADTLPGIRQAAQQGLAASTMGQLPTQGLRGGLIWPARYYIRRAAWHILDHAWEIEDRLEWPI